jgi:LPS-assembly protein
VNNFKTLKQRIILFLFCSIFSLSVSSLFAQDSLPPGAAVDLTGDTVEYTTDGQKMLAKGNVILHYNDVKLSCDEIQFERAAQIADAKGHIRFVTKDGELRGDNLHFNFGTMQGTFDESNIYMAPFYGHGKQISKVSDKKIEMHDSYITTCDLDKPHFRLFSKKIEVYPGDKMVARNTRLMLGNVPILYIPKFSQSLKDKEPFVTITPGYDKDWGGFLLTKWRYRLNDNAKGRIHLDYRERKDLAEGADFDYNTKRFGSGVMRTYYMNERNITSDRIWQKRPSPTIERERFKAEWRHKWDIDDKTNAIWQYYKLSDRDFLKDYFEKEFNKDSNPDTFFLLTHALPQATLSLRSDVRVNRFESITERLPEVQYDMPSLKLGESNFYLRDKTTFSNLALKDASPSEVHRDTMRLDTDNEFSYPTKLGILEFRPFVGGRNTYYSKTLDPEKYNSIRGIFRTGASLSTKFYKVLDVETNAMGLDIHQLRHILTPSVTYEYDHEPTVSASQLDQFDTIDAFDNADFLTFAIENKLQTKRNDKTVELLRAIVSTDYRLKDDPLGGGFNQITHEADFRPTDWLTLYSDSIYDTRKDHLQTANFDLYVNGGTKWRAGIGKRYDHDVDDQITADFLYRFNPLWSCKIYQRFDLDRGLNKEQDFTLTRDLHEWIMDIDLNNKRDEGTQLLFVFTLKAFPEMSIDAGSSLERRRAGSE